MAIFPVELQLVFPWKYIPAIVAWVRDFLVFLLVMACKVIDSTECFVAFGTRASFAAAVAAHDGEGGC
jgi:hypothetical protein